MRPVMCAQQRPTGPSVGWTTGTGGTAARVAVGYAPRWGVAWAGREVRPPQRCP